MSTLDFPNTMYGRHECLDDETQETVCLVALFLYFTLSNQEKNKGCGFMGLGLKGHLYGG